jgi:hypothetical protein
MSTTRQRTAPRRAVLLGASNVARGISTLVETASGVCGRPLEVLAAFGHGRSYGMRMSLLGRALPGIAECGLWEALPKRPPADTAALLTDVGNDLLYGVAPEDVAAWVQACLARLKQAGARTVLTPLPLCSITNLSRRKYLLLRNVLFPGSRVDHASALERARDLDRRLRALAAEHGAAVVEHRPEWYGLDPIHVRRRHWASAWREVLAPWAEGAPLPPPAAGSLCRWLRLRLLPPQQRWFFGREQRRDQPAGRLADGTTLAYY